MIEIAGGIVLAVVALVLVLRFWRVGLGIVLIGAVVVVVVVLDIVLVREPALQRERDAYRANAASTDCRIGEPDKTNSDWLLLQCPPRK
jgi:hypothetical protein